MSFPRYPKYKDSGVEWLGEVPEHWEASRLKRVVDPARHITYGIVQAGPNIPDGIPYVRPADMSDEDGVVDQEGVLRTSPEIASAYTRSMIREGDLVCSIGPSFGKVMMTPDWLEGGNLTQGTARIAVSPPTDSRFIFWVLRAGVSVQQWESSVGGATFRALNLGPLCETAISLPPPSEQTAIAAFLDRETAKIDGLVAEQRRLMELLKEKRQAVISHAVTKGLNPDAPMKPSGIEWLGDVPEHWVVKKLSLVLRESPKNGASPSITSDGTRPTFSIRAVRNGVVTIEDNLKYVEMASDKAKPFLVAKGDVLTLRGNGNLSLVATAGIVECEPPEGCIFPDIVIRLRPSEEMLSKMLVYYLNSDALRPAIDQAAQTASGVWKISGGSLSAIRLPVPPPTEQEAIVHYLTEALSEFDTLTAEAQRAIDLLQERRTALISAAVTGQIDVRQLAGEDAA